MFLHLLACNDWSIDCAHAFSRKNSNPDHILKPGPLKTDHKLALSLLSVSNFVLGTERRTPVCSSVVSNLRIVRYPLQFSQSNQSKWWEIFDCISLSWMQANFDCQSSHMSRWFPLAFFLLPQFRFPNSHNNGIQGPHVGKKWLASRGSWMTIRINHIYQLTSKHLPLQFRLSPILPSPTRRYTEVFKKYKCNCPLFFANWYWECGDWH